MYPLDTIQKAQSFGHKEKKNPRKTGFTNNINRNCRSLVHETWGQRKLRRCERKPYFIIVSDLPPLPRQP